MADQSHPTPVEENLFVRIAALNPAQKAEVLQFIEALKPLPSREERNRMLRELAGSISKEDCSIMQRVIEENCDPPDFNGFARGKTPSLTVPIEAFEKDFAAYLLRVKEGEPLLISQNDKPIAELRPPSFPLL